MHLFQAWLLANYEGVEEILGLNPEEHFEEYGDELEKRVLHSRFSDIMQAGTGFPNRIGSTMVHTIIEGPIVLELIHITDVGVSAFSLERTRQDRDQALYLQLLALARAGRTITKEGLLDLKRALPEYPRGVLKLILSDGHTEIQAVEYKRLPFKLGKTKIGLKVLFL
jgi:RecQ-mediated genome instability protein 1